MLIASREADLHKAFTSDSILKSNFYDLGFGTEQMLGGAAALIIIGVLISLAVIFGRHIFLQKGYKSKGGVLLLACGGLLVLSKILDRLPSELRKDYGYTLPVKTDLLVQSLEEGFEFFAPILIIVALHHMSGKRI